MVERPALPARPLEPPPSRWELPSPTPDSPDLVALGADLEPGTILAAYRKGLFPMPTERGRIGWWSPDPRGILPLEGLRVSRSLRRSCNRFELSVNQAFEEVLQGCADPKRPGAWIDARIRSAYMRLHLLGWVHSVEVWDQKGQLAGGLYGVSVGGLFAGESMFHRCSDASKVALVGLVGLLARAGGALLDVQWVTPHLASLGAVALPRSEYLRRLELALARPNLGCFNPV